MELYRINRDEGSVQTTENDSRSWAGEVTAIAAIPFLLAAIHFFVPGPLQQALAFNHNRFAIYTLFTSAYVHNSDAHLVGNVLGYLLATSYAYMLCLTVNERQWFRRTFVIFLVVLPVLVSLSSYAIFATKYPSVSPTSRGFSGVVAGFGGFLLVALAVYVRNRYSPELGRTVGYSAFLVLMAIIDFIYAGAVRLEVGGLVSFGLIMVGGAYVWENGVGVSRISRVKLIRDLGAVILVFVVLAYIVVNMFPADVVSNGRLTNIWAHAMGFLIGILCSVSLRLVSGVHHE